MTPEEKDDIIKEVIQAITGDDVHKTTTDATPWGAMRKKYDSLLFDRFGVYHHDQVWQAVRRLTCYAVGERYVRNFKPSVIPRAVSVASRIMDILLEVKDDDQC